VFSSPKRFPDNSVVCHAHRLDRGTQGMSAGASSIVVVCDHVQLAFFPNIYNKDWLFVDDEAAIRCSSAEYLAKLP
jgi:hypothetical protein